MKVTLFRNGTWFSGLCLDEITIKTDGEKTIDDLSQFIYQLEQLGYETENHHNNPFKKTEQHEFYNEYEDKVVVRFCYKNKEQLKILKQYNNIENCTTTVEVITRLGALNKLFDDIVNLHKNEYEVIK